MRYARHKRRRARHEAELDITAFLNLMVILVPFLLITAVFSRLTIIQLNMPAAASAGQVQPEDLQLEVVIRKNGLVVADAVGGLIKRIPRSEHGQDVQALTSVLKQIKARFPGKTDIALLSEPHLPYDELVQVIDAVRSYPAVQDGVSIHAELFPDIAIGDAPS